MSEDLMPGNPEAAEDLSNLRINFSEEEASSEAMDFDPVPSGKYHVRITDLEVRHSTSEKNPGKPYWSVEMTCQSGPYENRKFWGNVMLWEGAAYSLAQLLKATGNEKALKTGKIPDGQTLVGKELQITVQKARDTYKEKQNDDGVKLFKNEVKGYKAFDASATESSGSGSLLPG